MALDKATLPWSLFNLTPADESAIEALAGDSLLVPTSSGGAEELWEGIHAGTRVAVSAKTATEERYNGLCIFGLEQPSPSVEKGLALHTFSLTSHPPLSQTRYDPNRSSVAETLLAEVIRFSQTHGFTRIQCYVPNDAESLTLLTRLGFRVNGVSTDDEGDSVFALSLHIPASYTGDPYDGRHLLNWVAGQFHVEATETTDTTLDGRLPLRRLNPDLARSRLGELALPIRLVIPDRPAGREKVVLQAALGSASTPEAPVNLTVADLRELARNPRLDLTLWPPPRGGASIVVEVRGDLFDRFRTDRNNVFLDSGSYGTLLERAIAAGNRPQIFFIDYDTSQSNPRLIGVGRVREVERGDPRSLWTRWGTISSWPDEQSFRRYRAIKRKMTGIVFDDLKRVDVLGAGLPVVWHSWAYVPGSQAYAIVRAL